MRERKGLLALLFTAAVINYLDRQSLSVAAPVIGVPTSAGYGATFGGLSALLAMLTSCAAGVAVVNIDDGFGAGTIAARIARSAGVRE